MKAIKDLLDWLRMYLKGTIDDKEIAWQTLIELDGISDALPDIIIDVGGRVSHLVRGGDGGLKVDKIIELGEKPPPVNAETILQYANEYKPSARYDALIDAGDISGAAAILREAQSDFIEKFKALGIHVYFPKYED